jgi:ribosomal protein S20
MPIKRSALRQLRKDKRRAARNQAITSELKTLKKRALTLLATDRGQAQQLLPTVFKQFDRAASRGKIPKNQVAHLKSRLTRLAASPAK